MPAQDVPALLQEMHAVLQEEYKAARSVDLDVLLALQEEKRAVLEVLKKKDIEAKEIDRLGTLMRRNIGLLSHLQGCLRGLLIGPASEGYNGAGKRVFTEASPMSHARGVL